MNLKIFNHLFYLKFDLELDWKNEHSILKKPFFDKGIIKTSYKAHPKNKIRLWKQLLANTGCGINHLW